MNTLAQMSAAERVELLDVLERSLPFAGITTFMRMPHTRDLSGADLVVVGVPFDSGTLNRPGTRFGPRVIREQSVYASAF
ncbi:MAG: arginase family protein, partial [Roseiflexaceae bacterium]|nr:arginase family protein [Roseiflexaceae bacterium]